MFIGEIVAGVTLQFRHFKCPNISVIVTPDCSTRDVSAAIPWFKNHFTICIPNPLYHHELNGRTWPGRPVDNGRKQLG